MGVSIDENTPKWMVYKVPLFQETTIYLYIYILYWGLRSFTFSACWCAEFRESIPLAKLDFRGDLYFAK